MTQDPFAPARRALWLGPLIMAVGGVIVYFGIVGDGLAWLLCVLGGLVMLFGLLRFVAGLVALGMERRRQEILRDGEPATATVNSAKQLAARAGFPIYEMGLKMRAPDGTESIVSKRGAIPPQFAGSLEPGTEIPIRVRPSDKEFAVDWDAF